MWFDTEGTLVFGPDWCARLLLDPVIGKYYRHLYAKRWWHTKKLLPPMWGSHINIVFDEQPLRKEFWAKYAGKLWQLRIFPDEVFCNGNAYWFRVYCEAAEVYRAKLGLSRVPKVNFHYCIGYEIEELK